MKNLIRWGLTTLTLALLMLGCQSPINLNSSATPSGDTMTLVWGPTKARTLLPASYPTVATYDLTLKSPGLTDVTKTGLTGGSLSLSLVKAVWAVTIVGKDASGNTVVQGSATFDTAASSSANIALAYISSGTGTGTMTLAVDWASANAIYPVDSVSLKLTDPSGAVTTPTVSKATTTATYSTTSAAVGNWRAVFTLKSGNNTAVLMESVLVVQNGTTSGTITVDTSSFATPPSNLSAVTATFSGGNVNLGWTLPSTNQGDNIVIQRKLDTDDDTKYVVLTSTLSPTATSFTDTSGTVQGQGYVYRAALVNVLNEENPGWVKTSRYVPYTISTLRKSMVQSSSGWNIKLAIGSNGDVFYSVRYGGTVSRISSSGTESIFAGSLGKSSFSGDGGLATDAGFDDTGDLAVDSLNNVFIVDRSRIRKVDAAGIISTVAGNGYSGNTGDGGLATVAAIDYPKAITVDSKGNVYFVNSGFVRMIDTNGIISTLSVAPSQSCDDLAIDPLGNLYIANSESNSWDFVGGKILKIDQSGSVSTLAGNGSKGNSGDGGPALSAALGRPNGIAFDRSGALFISDSIGYIRRVDPYGTISTVAGFGGGNYYSGDGLVATAAAIGRPSDVVVDSSGVLYFADTQCNIRRVGPDIPATSVTLSPTTLSLIVGGLDSEPLTTTLSPMNATSTITWSSDKPSVATVSSSGVVSPVAAGTATITATTANGKTATCVVTVTEAVADPVFSPTAGTLGGATTVTITTATDGASIRYTLDGTIPTSTTGIPYSAGVPITVSKTFKAIAYKTGMSDSQVVTAAYTVPVTYSYSTSFTGVNNTHGSFNTTLYGVALDSNGNVYTTDQGWAETFKYSSTGTYTSKWGGSGSTLGKFSSPMGIVVSGSKIYVGDYTKRIQQFNLDGTSPMAFGTASDFGSKGVVALATDSTGRIYAFDGVKVTRWSSAGVKDTGFLIDDSSRIGYAFSADMGIAVDSVGNVYVASLSGMGLILKYNSSGDYISTIDSSYGWAPKGLAIDASDNLYAVVCPSSSGAYVYVYNSAGAKIGTIGTGLSGTENGDLNSPYGVAVSADGSTVWVADAGSSNRRLTKFVKN